MTVSNLIAGEGILNYQSGVSFKLNDIDNNQLPTPIENEEISKIEDALFQYLDDRKNSVVAIIITTNGIKEYIIYHKEKDFVSDRISEIQKKFPSHKLGNYQKLDKDWSLFESF